MIAGDLHARGIGLRVLTGKRSGVYSPSGEGKFFFTMMAAFAELERDIIHERTMAGLAAAHARARVGGRPSVAVLNDYDLRVVKTKRVHPPSPPRHR